MNKSLSERLTEVIPANHSVYYETNNDIIEAISDEIINMHETEGLALSAPDSVDISIHKNIPLLWLFRSTAYRGWQVENKRNSFLVVSDQVSGMISVWSAYAGQSKRFDFSSIPFSSKGSPPDAMQAQGAIADTRKLDLLAIMGNPPLKSTILAVTLTQYNWVSNTVQINLVDSTGNTPDIPKIPESVSRQIRDGYKTAVQHLKDSAVFSPSLNPPSILQNGITAVVPQKVKHKDHRWMIHGSIRVPVAPGAMVASTGAQNDPSDTPSAIVTTMVIINKLDNSEPSWITLKLPVLPICKPGDLVNVSFSADLKRFNEEFSDTGVYQVFVACGAYVAGPFALEVVR